MKFLWFGKREINNKLKVGLALGGGGARGFAHIGVIKAFEELGIDIDLVAGTSMGSVVGACYASGLGADKMKEIALSVKKKDILGGNIVLSSSSSENLKEFISSVIGDGVLFSELKRPFCAVAVDISSGTEVVIDHGFVCDAVAGSTAVPGIFKPVVWEDKHLVDGGLKNNVPADVCRKMGADIVFAIDVNSTRGSGTKSLKRISVLSSMIGVLMQSSIDDKLKFADFVLYPDLSEFKSTKLEGIEQMIQIGYDCVMQNKEEILKIASVKQSKRKRKLWMNKLKEK